MVSWPTNKFVNFQHCFLLLSRGASTIAQQLNFICERSWLWGSIRTQSHSRRVGAELHHLRSHGGRVGRTLQYKALASLRACVACFERGAFGKQLRRRTGVSYYGLLRSRYDFALGNPALIMSKNVTFPDSSSESRSTS